MKNTKLIQLLETFSASEFSEFGKFLNSPFHNENSRMRLLYNFLKKYYPLFSHKDFSKESTYYCLYSTNEVYDDKKLRERFSDMLRLAEEYLSIIQIKKNTVAFRRQVLKEYRARRLDKHFDKKYSEISSILGKVKEKNTDYFLNFYKNEKIRSDFYSNRKLIGKRKSLYDEFELEIRLFLNYFSTQMISDYCLMYNWEDNMNYKFDFEFYEPVMIFIEKNNLKQFPLVNAFYVIMKIRENEDNDSLYYELKDIYINNIEEFGNETKIRINTILINDAQKRSLKEKIEFESECFEVMKLALKYGVYTKEDGWLSREQYINYVMRSLYLGEVEWAEQFIKDYTFRVTPDKREFANLFVMGLLHFHKGEYKTALGELSAIKGGDYIYFVRIKVLQTKIYFEMSDHENVLTVIDSFKHYLSSNSFIPERVKNKYSNYINILNKLTLLKFNSDDFNTRKLIEEIKNFSIEDLTSNKHWLLEKAEELYSDK